MSLRVTIEYLPGGNTMAAEQLAVIEIQNVSQLAQVSDYALVVHTGPGRIGRGGFVRGHVRAHGFWPLVRRALEKVGT